MTNCKLLHDWGKWEDIVMTVRPALTSLLQGGPIIYGEPTKVDYQKKVCARCGKKKVRQI